MAQSYWLTFSYTEQAKNQFVSSFNTDADIKSSASAVCVDAEPLLRHKCDDSRAKYRPCGSSAGGSEDDLVYLRSRRQQLQTFSGSMGREMAFCVSVKLASPLEVQKRICI